MKLKTPPGRPDLHASHASHSSDRVTVSQYAANGRVSRIRITADEALALADALVDLVETPAGAPLPHQVAAKVRQNPAETAGIA